MPKSLDARVETAPQPNPKIFVPERALRPWSETRLLITGASSGIGLELTETFFRETDVDTIYLGTRSQESFEKALDGFEQRIPGFDRGRARIFPADFSKKGDAVAVWRQVQTSDKPITDIKQEHAGGMESFLRKRARELIGLRRLKRGGDQAAFEAGAAEVRKILAQDIAEAMPYAMAVNFEQPKALQDEAATTLKDPAMLGYESSLWASFKGKVPTPFLYTIIADTKGAMVGEDDRVGPELVRGGKYVFVDSGHIVTGTKVAGGFEGMLIPLLSDQDQVKMTGSAIGIEHMVQAGVDSLVSDPKQWGEYPRKRYVYTEIQEGQAQGQVQYSSDLTPAHPMFDIKHVV